MVDFRMIDLTPKKYFLFDMDGTMVDLEQLNYECFRFACKDKLNMHLSFEEYMQYMAGAGSTQGFINYLQSIEKTYDVKELVAIYRGQKAVALEKQFNEVVALKPGIKDFLGLLVSKGYKLAVGTSTARHFAEKILKGAGLYGYFHAIVAVEDAPRTKPAPDIFLKALELIGGNVKEAVVFEDSKNGVESAKNGGFDCVILRNVGKNDSVTENEPHVIDDYTAILPQFS